MIRIYYGETFVDVPAPYWASMATIIFKNGFYITKLEVLENESTTNEGETGKA